MVDTLYRCLFWSCSVVTVPVHHFPPAGLSAGPHGRRRYVADGYHDVAVGHGSLQDRRLVCGSRGYLADLMGATAFTPEGINTYRLMKTDCEQETKNTVL